MRRARGGSGGTIALGGAGWHGDVAASIDMTNLLTKGWTMAFHSPSQHHSHAMQKFSPIFPEQSIHFTDPENDSSRKSLSCGYFRLARATGLEPATTGSTGQYSHLFRIAVNRFRNKDLRHLPEGSLPFHTPYILHSFSWFCTGFSDIF
jgi:hypothetical protein